MQLTEIITIVSSIIAGGTLTTLVNLKIRRQSEKVDVNIKEVDFADKAVDFMDRQADKYIERIEKLEADVSKLMAFKCEKIDCPNRQPPTL